MCLVLFTQFPQKDPSINHTISTNIYEYMTRDISIVVARLVLLLRDSDSYKKLLASSEKQAQRLLDLLQDVSISLFIQNLLSIEQETAARS
jgi:hypothetical protein